jgi:hypothetical protein
MSVSSVKLIVTLVSLLLSQSLAAAQDDDNWPPLSYLRDDYRAVAVVAHVRIQEAEITGRVGGYENWKITSTVLEPLKGRLKKGDVIEYYQGAEAGLKREYFDEEKIVFLLAEQDRDRKVRYSVLENSTLPVTPDRLSKLRLIKKQSAKKPQNRSRP